MLEEKTDFTLIGHPFDLDHLYRYLQYHKPDFKRPSDQLLLKLFEWTPPLSGSKNRAEIKNRGLGKRSHDNLSPAA